MSKDYHDGHRIWLPGRRIDDLVCTDARMRIETKPHHCRGSLCPHPSHRARVERGVVFFNDCRPGSPWTSRHEGGAWVTFWTTRLHDELLAAWWEANGATTGEHTLVALEAIHWTGGETLLVGRARNGICSSWLTIEPAGGVS